jgi:hypothetical protein
VGGNEMIIWKQILIIIMIGGLILLPTIPLYLLFLMQDKNQPIGKYTAYEVEKGDWFRVDV